MKPLNWNGWPLDRVAILFIGLAFFLIFVQVTLFHYRQNFRHWSMWMPVIATPLFAICLVMLAFFNAGWLYTLLTILLVIGTLAGTYGSFAHIRGVGKRVGGYELRNFLTGPPLTLPAIMTALCIFGLIVLHWG